MGSLHVSPDSSIPSTPVAVPFRSVIHRFDLFEVWATQEKWKGWFDWFCVLVTINKNDAENLCDKINRDLTEYNNSQILGPYPAELLQCCHTFYIAKNEEKSKIRRCRKCSIGRLPDYVNGKIVFRGLFSEELNKKFKESFKTKLTLHKP